MKWDKIDHDINKYILNISLPNLVSFILYRLYINKIPITDSYITLYNTIKTYINIVDTNDYLVYRLVVDILKNKYNLRIISLNPIIIKNIDLF